MNQDLLIVPTYARPEMLFHCLDRLSKARHVEEHDVWIRADWHEGAIADHGNMEVIARFEHLKPKFAMCQPHQFWGNTFNYMTFYREALRTSYRYVYMVECDVFVSEDFFDWHRAVQERFNPWASVAVAHMDQQRHMTPEEKADPRGYFECQSYASLGVCFLREHLSPMLDYFNPVYLHGLLGYLDEQFPDSRYKGRSGSQDGLISRLIERHGLRTVYPTLPRAFHGGWYGFNRSCERRPTGSLQNRIHAVGDVLGDRAYLTAEYPDCEPCDLKAAPWNGELIEWPLK